LGQDQYGNTIRLKDYAGLRLILYFYPKDSTPACTATACSLRDSGKLLEASGYAVVGVSSDSIKSHLKFATKYQLDFPLIADEEKTVIKAYDVWGPKQVFGKQMEGLVRTTFIISPDAKIERVITEVETASHAEQVLKS